MDVVDHSEEAARLDYERSLARSEDRHPLLVRLARAEKHRRRAERFKAAVFARLGDRCALCGSTSRLEVDHVDGRAWSPRNVNRAIRWKRYFDELNAGVRLRALCRSCNGRDGQARQRKAAAR